MVGRLLPPLKNNKKAVIETAGGDKVRLSPHSTNFKLSFQKFYEQSLITYDEITRGYGGLLIRNCNVTGPLPLLLLATEIVVAPGNEDEDDKSDYEDADEDNGEEGNIKADLSEAHQGEKIMSSPDNTVKVIVDRWIPFESTTLVVAQIYCLRERLAATILFKLVFLFCIILKRKSSLRLPSTPQAK